MYSATSYPVRGTPHPLPYPAYATASCGIPLGRLHSEQGVQQGDALGPLLFSLLLNILASIQACPMVPWYLDDGVLAGPRSAVFRVLTIIQELRPSLGLIPECESFRWCVVSLFPPLMKRSSYEYSEHSYW